MEMIEEEEPMGFDNHGKANNRQVHRNADRERNRVQSLRIAFQSLQACIPSVPADTKLSKLDILILATNYIAQLSKLLETDPTTGAQSTMALDFGAPFVGLCSMRTHRYLKFYHNHPIKKWPMRSRLYGNFGSEPTQFPTPQFPTSHPQQQLEYTRQ